MRRRSLESVAEDVITVFNQVVTKYQTINDLLVLLQLLLHLLHAGEDALRATRTLGSQNHLDRLTERHVAEEVQTRLRITFHFIHHHSHVGVVLASQTAMEHSTNQGEGGERKLRNDDSVVATFVRTHRSY